MNTVATKTNLLGLDREAMRAFFADLGEKPYRADQVCQWIHTQGINHFEHMTNLSKALRQRLCEVATIQLPDILYDKIASDGTHKWIIRLHDGNCIETVFIPEKTRGTLCISSQVGCVLNCDFCSTGKQGFNRHLTAAEIIAQLWIAVRKCSKTNGIHDHAITNVVMMGMGEPLLNFDSVITALKLMLDDYAYGLSKRRVTVSTAGIVPAIYELRNRLDVALAVSLHAPNDALRNQLVPINKKYPIDMLMTACRDYFKNDPRRSVTIEYTMLKSINDTPIHAKQLIKILSDIRAKVNLIPFNPFPNTSYERSEPETIQQFQSILMNAGIHTTIRRTRGDDIDAACGQLIGDVIEDKTRRRLRQLKTVKKKLAENQ